VLVLTPGFLGTLRALALPLTAAQASGTRSAVQRLRERSRAGYV
jgi:hypothetical protein